MTQCYIFCYHIKSNTLKTWEIKACLKLRQLIKNGAIVITYKANRNIITIYQ